MDAPKLQEQERVDDAVDYVTTERRAGRLERRGPPTRRDGACRCGPLQPAPVLAACGGKQSDLICSTFEAQSGAPYRDRFRLIE